MSPPMGSNDNAAEGQLSTLLGGIDGQSAEDNNNHPEDVQVRSIASHEVTLYILEDDDDSTTDPAGVEDGHEEERVKENKRGPLHESNTRSGSRTHTSSRDSRHPSRSRSSSSSSTSATRHRSDPSKGRNTSSTSSSRRREAENKERDRSRSNSSSSKTKRRGSTSSSASRRHETSPSPAPPSSRHRSRSDNSRSESADARRKSSSSSSREHLHRDSDEKRSSDARRSRSSSSSSARKRSGSGDSNDMDRSRRTSTRRTRSRTPRTGGSSSGDAHPHSTPKSPSSRSHRQHSSSSLHRSPSPSRSPRASSHNHMEDGSEHHHRQNHHPHRSRSASCHRHRSSSVDDEAPTTEERRSRSTSRPKRLPQYSSMQQQQLLQRLHGSGSDDRTAHNGSMGTDPAAYVLTTPESPPALTTTRDALRAPPLASPTATLRDAIMEQTARQRSKSPQPRGRGGNGTTTGGGGGARGSDPPGHYLGGSNESMEVASSLAHHAPDPDAMRGSQVAASHQQQQQSGASSPSSTNGPTASSSTNLVAAATGAAGDPDHSSASASTSTSLQLFIRDPAQVSQLVSHRTIVTLETKESKLKANRFGRDNGYDDDDDASDDDDGAPGDDMSIFSELWGSSVNISAKVEEDKAVAHASNPNLQFDLTSPNKAPSTKDNRKPPKKTKSESSGKSMMRSLSDMLEANMGSLLDSPDRPKRRPHRNASPDRSSPKDKKKKDILWDGTSDDDDDDACSLLLDDENGQKACSSLAAVKNDVTVAPRSAKESNGTGQFGKIKDAGVSLFKSPSQWLKSPVSAQVRPHIPPPPQPQPEQAPVVKVQPTPTVAPVRGDSQETSETMATSFDLSLTESSNVAAVKLGMSARKEPTKMAAKLIPTLGPGIDENLTAFSSILDANSELTKTEAPGFTKFVDSSSKAKSSNGKSKAASKGSRFHHFGRPALSNPLSGVISSAQRVFRPRHGLSSAEPATPSPKPKRGVVNCYDMRGFDDEY